MRIAITLLREKEVAWQAQQRRDGRGQLLLRQQNYLWLLPSEKTKAASSLAQKEEEERWECSRQVLHSAYLHGWSIYRSQTFNILEERASVANEIPRPIHLGIREETEDEEKMKGFGRWPVACTVPWRRCPRRSPSLRPRVRSCCCTPRSAAAPRGCRCGSRRRRQRRHHCGPGWAASGSAAPPAWWGRRTTASSARRRLCRYCTLPSRWRPIRRTSRRDVGAAAAAALFLLGSFHRHQGEEGKSCLKWENINSRGAFPDYVLPFVKRIFAPVLRLREIFPGAMCG